DIDWIELVLFRVADIHRRSECPKHARFRPGRGLEHPTRIVNTRIQTGEKACRREENPWIPPHPNRVSGQDPGKINRAIISSGLIQWRPGETSGSKSPGITDLPYVGRSA